MTKIRTLVLSVACLAIFGAMNLFANSIITANNDAVTLLRGSPPAAANNALQNTSAQNTTGIFTFINASSATSPTASIANDMIVVAIADNAFTMNIRPPIAASLTLINVDASRAATAGRNEITASPPAAESTAGANMNYNTAAAESPPTAIATSATFSNYTGSSTYAIYLTTTAGSRPDIVQLC